MRVPRDVAVQVDHRQRLVADELVPDRAVLGLRLGDEVAVHVEAVAVGAGAQDAAVRVHGHDDRDDVLLGQPDHVRVVGEGQLVEQLEGGVRALPLVAVDVVVDEERRLPAVVAAGRLGRGRRDGVRGAQVGQPLPLRPRRVRHRRGDDHHVQVASERALADDLDADPLAGLQGPEPGREVVVRHEVERDRGVGRVDRHVHDHVVRGLAGQGGGGRDVERRRPAGASAGLLGRAGGAVEQRAGLLGVGAGGAAVGRAGVRDRDEGQGEQGRDRGRDPASSWGHVTSQEQMGRRRHRRPGGQVTMVRPDRPGQGRGPTGR